MKEPKIFKDCWPGLKTVYDTPHECGVCMEHIGEDWQFCPYCGNKLYEEETPELKPCPFCGDTYIEQEECVTENNTCCIVSCSFCGAQTASQKSMDNAVKLWNQRV